MASTSSKAEPPITFAVRGIKPDTQLTVFKRTFHVHSHKLKECSAFFFKFMDSPDKVTTPRMGQFKYTWITKVDEDGTWTLGSKSDLKYPAGNIADFKKDPHYEESMFEKLLYAFYGLIASPIMMSSLP